MKKQTPILAVLTALAFVLSTIAVPLASAMDIAQATHATYSPHSSFGQSGEVVTVAYTNQLPSFIPADAVPMSDSEMDEVKGEVVLWVAVMAGMVITSILYSQYLAFYGGTLTDAQLDLFGFSISQTGSLQ